MYNTFFAKRIVFVGVSVQFFLPFASSCKIPAIDGQEGIKDWDAVRVRDIDYIGAYCIGGKLKY